MDDGSADAEINAKILYELSAMQQTVNETALRVEDLVQMTGPGGALHDAQLEALESIGVWERLFATQGNEEDVAAAAPEAALPDAGGGGDAQGEAED